MIQPVGGVASLFVLPYKHTLSTAAAARTGGLFLTLPIGLVGVGPSLFVSRAAEAPQSSPVFRGAARPDAAERGDGGFKRPVCPAIDRRA